jgi:ABC-type amino acid transport substrate-binding protein
MTKILTGGVAKAETAEAVEKLGLPGVEVVTSNDMDAAMKLRAGQADYYLGTCHTGAGASLGVLVGLMGAATHTFGRKVPTEQEIAGLLADGKKVFGFSMDQIDAVVPLLLRAIAARPA